jgi:hypothetical protein
MTGLLSEFHVVADVAALGVAKFPIHLQCLWLLVLHVLMQHSCIGLLW